MMNLHEQTARLIDDLGSDAIDELIIYDHGSDDPRSIQWLAEVERRPKVRVDRREAVPAASLYRSWNDTIRRAITRYPDGPVDVVILNNDLRVPRGFVRFLTRALRTADPTIMITFPDARAPLALGVPWKVRLTPTKGLAIDGGMTGWAFALKGEAFRGDLPLIDERLKFYSGDRDLIHSVEAAGYTAARVDGLPAVHERGATRRRRPELKEQQDRDVRLWWGKNGIRDEKEASAPRTGPRPSQDG
jgi:hypothetical protein